MQKRTRSTTAGRGKILAVASPADVEILRCEVHTLWQALKGHLPSWNRLLDALKQPCLLHNVPLLHTLRFTSLHACTGCRCKHVLVLSHIKAPEHESE